MWIEGRDAEYASGIGQWSGVVAGNCGGPNAYHVWPVADWLPFRTNPKLPVWVAGYDGTEEGKVMASVLTGLGFPQGCPIAVDLESRVDGQYLHDFAVTVRAAKYKVIVKGAVETVFGNPAYNGYWVVDWTGQAHMYGGKRVCGVQHGSLGPCNLTAWNEWAVQGMWT